MNYTYEEAKTLKEKLEEQSRINSKRLQSFEKNSIGLTPDHIRETKEWQEAKQASEKSFAELRNFNQWFVKTFKKEYREDRNKRYKQA